MPKSTDVQARLSQLEQNIVDLQYGLYKTPWGPGGISNKLIKPKTIDAGLISVDDLESVNSKTGDLSLTGSLTLTTNGVIKAGQTAYDTGTGYWLEFNAGTPRLSLGNSLGNKLTWNGTTLSITGTLTATTGAIGGWTIGSTSLTSGSGASTVGLDTSGGSTPAIYAGSATASSAPFRVTQAGALTATNVTITGGAVAGITVDSTNGFLLGSGATARGVSTGSTAFYAGNATPGSAPFRVSSGGALVATSATITGAITATSGSFTGTIITSNIDADGGTVGGWTLSSSTLTGGSVTLDSTNGIIRSGASSYSTGTGWILDNNSGTPRFRVGTATSGANYMAFDGTNVVIRGKLQWGSTGDNYVDSSIMHFEVPTSPLTSTIEWKHSTNAAFGYVQALINGSSGDMQFGVSNATVYAAYSEYTNSSSAATAAMFGNGPTFGTAIECFGRSTAAASIVEVILADHGGASTFQIQNDLGTYVAGFASTGNPAFLASAGGTVVDTSATTLGAVTAVLQVFNTTGSSLGYIPIYASYT